VHASFTLTVPAPSTGSGWTPAQVWNVLSVPETWHVKVVAGSGVAPV
jgi:hypothetical protein